MSSPDADQVKADLQQIIGELDKFIALVESKTELTFSEFLDGKGSINLSTIKVWDKMSLLTILDVKYSKPFENMRKLLRKMLVDDRLEKKYLGKNKWGVDLSRWESEYKRERFKADLIKFYKKIRSEMVKISNKLG